MKKAQYEKILAHIQDKYSPGYRLRLNLTDGKWAQGKSELLGTDVLVVTQDNGQLVYLDLNCVQTITVG